VIPAKAGIQVLSGARHAVPLRSLRLNYRIS
jgi:hypothetical protein